MPLSGMIAPACAAPAILEDCARSDGPGSEDPAETPDSVLSWSSHPKRSKKERQKEEANILQLPEPHGQILRKLGGGRSTH